MFCECGQNFVITFLKCIKAFQEAIKFHLLSTGDEKFRIIRNPFKVAPSWGYFEHVTKFCLADTSDELIFF